MNPKITPKIETLQKNLQMFRQKKTNSQAGKKQTTTKSKNS